MDLGFSDGQELRVDIAHNVTLVILNDEAVSRINWLWRTFRIKTVLHERLLAIRTVLLEVKKKRFHGIAHSTA